MVSLQNTNMVFEKGAHVQHNWYSLEVMEQWTEDLDKKNSIDVIYLDFQKAFDTGLCHTSV